MRLVAGVISLFVLALLPACKPESQALVGAPAPTLTALDLEGRGVDLDGFRGKIVFVNFWWSGCGPCLAEMPEIDDVYRARGDEDFVVLAVNMGQDAAEILAVRRLTRVSYPLLMDKLKIDAQKYGVIAAPTSFLIDRDGHLIERVNGPLTREQLDARLDEIG